MKRLFSHVEEKELVRWITCLTIADHPPRHKTLYEMAQKIHQRCVSKINEDGMQLIEYNDIGRQWVRRFLLRHPDLASITPLE